MTEKVFFWGSWSHVCDESKTLNTSVQTARIEHTIAAWLVMLCASSALTN